MLPRLIGIVSYLAIKNLIPVFSSYVFYIPAYFGKGRVPYVLDQERNHFCPACWLSDQLAWFISHLFHVIQYPFIHGIADPSFFRLAIQNKRHRRNGCSHCL